MKTIAQVLATFGLGATLAAPALASERASFQGLGHLEDGQTWSDARAISADGRSVVGISLPDYSTGLVRRAYRWTEETGMVSLGDVQGSAERVSADGRVVVGEAKNPRSAPFVWTSETGMTFPVLPPEIRSGGGFSAISDDGRVAAGHATSWYTSWTIDGSYLWTAAGGFERLPGVRVPVDFSADGSVLAHDARVYHGPGTFDRHNEAARWTADGGVLLLGLGPAEIDGQPSPFTESFATGISADGHTIVGYLWNSHNPPEQSFLWTEEGGMQLLGDLPGGLGRNFATDVSADGRVVTVSVIVPGSAPGEFQAVAAVWDARHGMRQLQQVLETEFGLGAELSGWWLVNAEAISDDGLAIAGHGTNPEGETEAFLVTLPRPLDVVAAGIDVVPGSDANVVRFTASSLVAVALLGSDALDVREIDPSSLAFGPSGTAPFRAPRHRDVNRDGRRDLVAFFRVADTGIALGDTQACLRAHDLDGEPFEGCDAVSTLQGCGGGFGAALLLPPVLWLRRRRA
jgi:uncharacterized membrane protein